MTNMKPVRRIVTIDDDEGKSLAIADGPSPDIHTDAARPGYSRAPVKSGATAARDRGLDGK